MAGFDVSTNGRFCPVHKLPFFNCPPRANLAYDTQRSSIAKLQAALYQPSKQVEVISQSENKQITAWGDTRNKADHGRFSEITQTEIVVMIMGVRSFIDKHLSGIRIE
jgi:hypothetical protein